VIPAAGGGYAPPEGRSRTIARVQTERAVKGTPAHGLGTPPLTALPIQAADQLVKAGANPTSIDAAAVCFEET
jgi:hypothetical protein